MPIAKSYASSSLLAEMMINKYVDHLPFHRQLERFRRVGVHLPPSTVNDWFKDVADLLRPLYFRLWELILQTDYIQSDETTIPVIHDEKHKTVKGYIWLVRSVMTGRQFFYYDNGSRAGRVVLKLFSKFRGAIQTDGYERYDLLDAKKGIILLGCWPMPEEKENKVRPVACGRKNYLFCGNHDAAEDAAVLYSFFGCCKSAGVDFRTWLIYFLEHIHDYDNDYSTDLAELLPDNLKAYNKLASYALS